MADCSLGARSGWMHRLGRPLMLAVGGWLGSGACVDAASTRSQAVVLQPGWNAVYLEVQPAASSPTNVFAGSPVQAVAWFRKGGLDSKYIRNPGDAPWRSEGWSVWYAPGQTDAVLTDLHDIRGGQAYLIRASAAVTLNITGEARVTQLDWQPNNCSFTGLPVSDTQGPTFQEFFAGSPAHSRHRIYRLESGVWKIVRDPATARAKAGEAYWIQTDGASRYQGPIRLNLPASGEIDFSRTVDAFPLQIVNAAPTSRSNVTITLSGGTGALNLVEAVQDPGALTYRRANFTGGVVSASLSGERVLRLEPDRVALTVPTNTTLLRLTDGTGFQQWIPVRAIK